LGQDRGFRRGRLAVDHSDDSDHSLGRALTADPAFLPTAPDIAGVRRFLWAEVVFFAFIPAFAAAMARGYGAH
jgi:hypothetical protein